MNFSVRTNGIKLFRLDSYSIFKCFTLIPKYTLDKTVLLMILLDGVVSGQKKIQRKSFSKTSNIYKNTKPTSTKYSTFSA